MKIACRTREAGEKTEGIGKMKVYKKIMDGLAMIEKVILSVITVVVTVVTFANVVVRYASDSQFAWSEELVINLFVLMIMMGCALCARDGSLISLSQGQENFCGDRHRC